MWVSMERLDLNCFWYKHEQEEEGVREQLEAFIKLKTPVRKLELVLLPLLRGDWINLAI